MKKFAKYQRDRIIRIAKATALIVMSYRTDRGLCSSCEARANEDQNFCGYCGTTFLDVDQINNDKLNSDK